jgi:hypothetical protein
MDTKFNLVKRRERNVRKFNVKGTEFTLRIANPPDNATYDEAFQHLSAAVDEMLGHIKQTEEIEDGDMMRLSITASTLDNEIWIPFMRSELLTADRVFVEVERVLQSKKEWVTDSDMRVSIVHAKMPSGGGFARSINTSAKLSDFLTRKKSILNLKPDRFNLCCARAIVVGQAKLQKYHRMRRLKDSQSLQIKAAKQLHGCAGVSVGKLIGPREWAEFQAVLPKDTSLVVISHEYFNAIVFHGNNSARKKIVLFHAAKHYSLITSMTGFLSRCYVCTTCLTGYNNRGRHRCRYMCAYCKSTQGPCVKLESMFCQNCDLLFVSEDCLNNHLLSGLCGQDTRCKKCGKIFPTAAQASHKCYHKLCGMCKKMMPYQHRCYMAPLKRKKYDPYEKFVFYDFESMLDSENNRHIPNLCVAHSVCASCMSRPIDSPEKCPCGRHRVYFKGPDTAERFCDWLFDGEKKGTTCIAHNSQGYDVHFVVSYLHEHRIKPDMIHNGRKLLFVGAKGLRFLDSLAFMPMGLASLPKAFGLPDLMKGQFPFLFNTVENQEYVGPLPDEKFYNVDGMSAEKREEFKLWYNENKGREFNLQSAMLAYCKSDVQILQRACGIFRDMFLQHTGIEPFSDSITLPSACNRVFRTMFLKQDQIGLIPPQGYFKGNQSSIGLCWLEYESRRRKVKIAHAGNSGEVSICGLMVDGFDKDNGTVFTFKGCLWHACLRCFKDRSTINKVNGFSMHELYSKTVANEAKIRKAGYKIVEEWECSFNAKLKGNEELQKLREKFRKYDKLEPRHAFYGGRTNATRLHYEADTEAGETIAYKDIISLYPYVIKYCKLPTGHPTVITDADEIGPHIEGLIKCTVLPPRNLFHPVLPVRMRSKLLFPLCRTCALENVQHSCKHENDSDRAICGTWTSPELRHALGRGYRVIEYHEAWHFENTEIYDKANKQGGLWTAYVNLWLKLKQQASGFPLDCQTEVDKQKYIDEYREIEGIDMDRECIKKNPGLR